MYRKEVSWFCLLATCSIWTVTSGSFGSTLTFDFSGAVDLGGGTVFGIGIGDVPVSGQLIVDTTAAQTHDFGDGRIGYRQTIPSGLTATFGSGASRVDVVANEYLVVIGNDVLGGSADSVEFLFQSDLVPPLASPLVVNSISRKQGDYNGDGVTDASDYSAWKSQFGASGGAADGNGNGIVDAADYTVWRDGRPTGFFSIEFLTAVDPTLFSSSSLSGANLATNLNTTNFASEFNRLGDNPDVPEVFFDLLDFSLRQPSALQVPEPGELNLIIPAVAMLVFWRSRAGMSR